MSTPIENFSINLTDTLRQHINLVRGHDAVHPDRADCGGLGSCALMRAEHDSEEEVISFLESCAKYGYALTVTASRKGETA